MFNRMMEAERAAVENMQFYPDVPVVAALRVTWEGNLWVERSTDPGASKPGPIDVLAPDGRYIGHLPRWAAGNAGGLRPRWSGRLPRKGRVRGPGHRRQAIAAECPLGSTVARTASQEQGHGSSTRIASRPQADIGILASHGLPAGGPGNDPGGRFRREVNQLPAEVAVLGEDWGRSDNGQPT